MRQKVGRGWGPNIPIQRTIGEVAWAPGGLIAMVTGERHTTRRKTGFEGEDRALNIERQEDLANPGLQGVE